ncbi:hypothetical protein [Acinetobacter venetianus]|uniref:hypothetical protein n=1 Tax=Acinetobacter venetianus TaxID=52133 RepID=UPI003A91E15A
MSYVTTQLGDESGIQYRGVEDKTNINQIGNMANMLMLVEDVPRGRLDQAMTITQENKDALLGKEKGNLYLQAVEDALNTGVPSIQVMRIKSSSGCAAVGFVKDPNDFPLFPNVSLSTNFSVVDWPIQTFNYEPDDPENQTTNYIYKYLNALLEHLKTITVNDVPLVTGGSGGLAYFQKSGYGSLTAASGDEVLSLSPVNITLYANGNQANDPILAIFGQSPMILHSCGYKEWEGY